MSRFSRSFKKVAPKVTGGFNRLYGGIANAITGTDQGYQPGSENPFAPPDLSFLRTRTDLTKGYRPIDTTGTDSMFNDLLTNIGGQNQNDTAQLNQLLGDIGIDEKNTVGNLKSDFLDRGLGGPGQISDIEASGLAQARSDADRTRAGARTATVGAGLNRLNSAYSGRYAGGLDTAKTNAGTYNDLLKTGAGIDSEKDQTLAKLMQALFSNAATNQTNAYLPATPGLFESIIRNFGPAFGKTIGERAGGSSSDGLKAIFAGPGH